MRLATLAALVAVLACVLHGAHACGMVTHNLIAERARQWFKDTAQPAIDIAAHIDALQGGAPYPDYIADINWHGLAQIANGQGFLRTLGAQNYNCSGDLCPVAHTEGDTGGEFVAAYQYNLTFLLRDRWYVPVKDLVEIYKYAPQYVNKTVTPASIEECESLFFIASWAIKQFGSDLFPTQVVKAPFLPQEFQDFFVGGTDDNSAWTSFMWPRMLLWARTGPPPAPLPPIDAVHGPARPLPPALSAVVQRLKPLLRAGKLDDLIAVEQGARGTYVGLQDGAASSPASALVRDVLYGVLDANNNTALAGPRDHTTRTALETPVVVAIGGPKTIKLAASAAADGTSAPTPTMSQAGGLPNEYFGAALCAGDLDHDGVTDVVIGSPGRGASGDAQRGMVTVQYSSLPLVTISGIDTYGRFGAACAVVDFNGDGSNDLLVGAPQTGGRNLTAVAGSYVGAVQVYLGGDRGLPLQPNTTITTPAPFAQLGAVITLINGVGVAFSCPTDSASAIQTGSVAIFRAVARTLPRILPLDHADIYLHGPEPFGQFGASVGFTGSSLVVGAPGARSSHGTVGAVFIYELSAVTGVLTATLTATIRGVEDRASFGAAVAFGPLVAGIGAPGAGKALISPFDHDAEGNVFVTQPGSLTTLRGDHTTADIAWTVVKGGADFAKLGTGLVAAGADALVITSPQRDHEAGAVVCWREGRQVWRAEGAAPRMRLGAAIALVAVSATEKGKPAVAIGAPRWTEGAVMEAGTVTTLALGDAC